MLSEIRVFPPSSISQLQPFQKWTRGLLNYSSQPPAPRKLFVPRAFKIAALPVAVNFPSQKNAFVKSASAGMKNGQTFFTIFDRISLESGIVVLFTSTRYPCLRLSVAVHKEEQKLQSCSLHWPSRLALSCGEPVRLKEIIAAFGISFHRNDEPEELVEMANRFQRTSLFQNSELDWFGISAVIFEIPKSPVRSGAVRCGSARLMRVLRLVYRKPSRRLCHPVWN